MNQASCKLLCHGADRLSDSPGQLLKHEEGIPQAAELWTLPYTEDMVQLTTHSVNVGEGLYRASPTHCRIRVRKAIRLCTGAASRGAAACPSWHAQSKVQGRTLAIMPASAGSCSLKEAFLKADTSTRLPSTGTSMMGKLRPTSMAPLNSFFT